jgi:hypothetical protein
MACRRAALPELWFAGPRRKGPRSKRAGAGRIGRHRRMVAAAFGAHHDVNRIGEEGIWEGKSARRCKVRLGSFYRARMGGEAAGGGERPVAELNFNAFKVSVFGCNGRGRLCRLWEGKGGLGWHLSWRGSGGWMAQQWGSARLWPVVTAPSVA